MEIELERIGPTWHARIKGNSMMSVRGSGPSKVQAVGQLVLLFPTSCGLIISEHSEADTILAASAADWVVP